MSSWVNSIQWQHSLYTLQAYQQRCDVIQIVFQVLWLVLVKSIPILYWISQLDIHWMISFMFRRRKSYGFWMTRGWVNDFIFMWTTPLRLYISMVSWHFKLPLKKLNLWLFAWTRVFFLNGFLDKLWEWFLPQDSSQPRPDYMVLLHWGMSLNVFGTLASRGLNILVAWL